MSIRSDRAQKLVQQTPTTSQDALQLLQDIDRIYKEIHQENRERVEPLYEAIRQVHRDLQLDSKGLWGKRQQVSTLLAQLVQDETKVHC